MKWPVINGVKVRPTFIKRVMADWDRLGYNISPSGLTADIVASELRAKHKPFIELHTSYGRVTVPVTDAGRARLEQFWKQVLQMEAPR